MGGVTVPMVWARDGAEAITCPPWTIRKGGWLGGTVYRLFHGARLIAICPTADSAKARAERGLPA